MPGFIGPKRKSYYKNQRFNKTKGVRTYSRKVRINRDTTKQVGLLGVNPKVNFKYSDLINLNPTIFTVYSFMVNSLYDPNYTGGGHQPAGFDQIAALYKHYIIMRATVIIRAINLSATVPAYIGGAFSRLTLTGDLDGSNPVQNFEEQSSAKTMILGVAGSGAEVKTFTMSVVPHRFMGVKNPMSDDRFWGDNTANPSESVFWNLLCCSVDNASNPNVAFDIKIKFFSVWREPLRLAIN